MKKILFIITFMFFSGVSFAGIIDKCCIIDTLNYRENLRVVNKEISSKYPKLKDEVDNYVVKIIDYVDTNKKFKKHKIIIYKKISEKIIDYVYNHNIQRGTPSFLMLSYFALRMYDLYQYEKNPSKYNLETKLEMLDKNPYAY